MTPTRRKALSFTALDPDDEIEIWVDKSVKSQRIASGYRSDSVLGPSLSYQKKGTRINDKISNLHKSTENLKSQHVEMGSFTKNQYSIYDQVKTTQADHLYVNLPNSNQYSSHSINTPSNNSISTGQIIKPPRPRIFSSFRQTRENEVTVPCKHARNLSYPPRADYTSDSYDAGGTIRGGNTSNQPPKLDVKLASNVDTPWSTKEPSVNSAANRNGGDLAPIPPKRTESSRFSSRLKRKKENKSTPSSTPEPSKTANNNSSFFAKASQMFRKRKKERPLTYAELMRLFAPPPPSSLLRAHHTEGLTSENYTYNVKVGMRVSPNAQNKESILSVDESKSQVYIANETLYFDYVHGPGSKQSDVSSSLLSEALPAILHGRSVVVVTFGKNSQGRQYSLIGSRDSTQTLGLVPTAVTWLNKIGEEDRSKCGPNIINIASLRLDERKSLSEFVSPVTISKGEELGKYLDKLTLTLPAREQPNEEALIINMTFSIKGKSKKKTKDSFGMLTFIDIGTPLRNNSNVLAWSWLQDVTQATGDKYIESFVQLRHNLMQRQSHVMCLGHITHSPKDYQAIGITLNLATRLYMRHLPPHKLNQIQKLKKEKDYSSATSTGEESADTVIYRGPGMISDGEGPPKSYLPERTKGDGQEKSPQFLSNKRGGNGSYHSDNEGGKLRRQHPHQQYRSRGGYHSDTGGMKRGGYSSGGDSYKPSNYTRPSKQAPRHYAMTDTEDHNRSDWRSRQHKQFSSDTEDRMTASEPKRRVTTSRNAATSNTNGQTPEDIRQKRVQKNQQQLKRYFELLRLKNQREALLQQSREMRGVSSPEPGTVPEEIKQNGWSVENPTKFAPPPDKPVAEVENKENEEVQLRTRTRSESRNKGDNRRLYTIYDTEDDGGVLDQYLTDSDNKPKKIRSSSGYKSDSGVKTSRQKTEISREWLEKIKKKRHMPPGGKFIDYGNIDLDEKPQIKEIKPQKRVKGSLSEDELLTRRHGDSINNSNDLLNKNLRYSDRRFDKRSRSGYSTDAEIMSSSRKSRTASGYQSDVPKARAKNSIRFQGDENKRKVDDISLDDLYKQVVEVDHLVSNKMHWRGAATDLDYFDQQIRILERRNSLIEKLRRKQFELLSELKSTKSNLMSKDWKPDRKLFL